MSYRFSTRSLQRLFGVNPKLVDVVKTALSVSKVDFSVTEGVRTRERQDELIAAGMSRTQNSRHLTGDAVDLAPWVSGKTSWKWVDFVEVARAMKSAAAFHGVALKWGAVWDREFAELSDDLAAEALDYRERRSGAFLDGVHFELM